MSADPVTMFAITAVKTLHDIKETKKQSKIEQQRYQDRIQRIAEQAKREEEDRIERAGIDLQNRVRSAYVSLAKRFNHRYVSINGDDSIESIHNAIIDKMKKKNLIK